MFLNKNQVIVSSVLTVSVVNMVYKNVDQKCARS